MEDEYREMAAKAKEMRDIITLQNKMTGKVQQKVGKLMEALPDAKNKLEPTNSTVIQLQQVGKMVKEEKTEIASPQLLKKINKVNLR